MPETEDGWEDRGRRSSGSVDRIDRYRESSRARESSRPGSRTEFYISGVGILTIRILVFIAYVRVLFLLVTAGPRFPAGRVGAAHSRAMQQPSC